MFLLSYMISTYNYRLNSIQYDIRRTVIVLNQKYSDNFQRTLNSIIDYNDFPTELIKREQKQQFVQSISTLRNNKRRLREIVKEFSCRCRGIFHMFRSISCTTFDGNLCEKSIRL